MPTRGRHFLFPSAKKGLDKPAPAEYNNTIVCGFSSSGRAPPCQGGGSEFESRNPLQQKSKAFCLAFFVLQLLRDSNRATRQGSNSPGDCCGARVRAGARRSAPGESRNPLQQKSKAFCLAFFVLQLLRDSNRATRQGSNSPGDCCGARVRAGARRSAPGESRNPLQQKSKAFCLAFFVLQLLRDSNRATRQGSNSPGDCCGARVRAGARRSAPHFAHHTPPRLWPNLPAPPYLAALQGDADLLQ